MTRRKYHELGPCWFPCRKAKLGGTEPHPAPCGGHGGIAVSWPGFAGEFLNAPDSKTGDMAESLPASCQIVAEIGRAHV